MAGLVANDDERQRMRENAQRFNQQVGGMVRPAVDAVGQAARSVVNAGLVVPRTIKGVATGEIPVTFSHLPDYRNAEQRAADDRAQALARKQAEADANPMATPSPLPQQGTPRLGIKPRMDQVLTDAAQRMRPAIPNAATAAGPAPQPAIDLRNPIPDSVTPDTPAAAQAANQTTAQDNGWSRTGIGLGKQGGEIVGRIGENGVPEFTNDAATVAGAGLRKPVGSVDGSHGLSYGQDGDAQRSMTSLAQANAIRSQPAQGFGMRSAMQARDLDMAGIQAGLRSNSADERMAARRMLRAQVESDKNTTELVKAQMDASYRGADIGLRERALMNDERQMAGEEEGRNLQRQRTQQELEMGDMELSQARRRDALLQQLGSPDLPQEQRASIMQQLQGLSGKSADAMSPRDYIIKQRVPMTDAYGNPIGTQEVLIDGRTGQPFGQQSQAQPQAPKAGDQVGGYRFKGGNPADQNNWEAI